MTRQSFRNWQGSCDQPLLRIAMENMMSIEIYRIRRMTKKQHRKRAKPGDLLELSTAYGLAYVHFVGRHHGYGDGIYVYPNWYANRPTTLKCVCKSDRYLTFYPVQSAVRQGLVEIVGSAPLASDDTLRTLVLRRRGFTTPEGQVLAWIIERDGNETLKRTLTDEERKLPIASVWNHEYLIEMIASSWRPEQEG